MTEGSPLLSVDGISIRRTGRFLLEGVSFDVQRAEILGVIGPNGAGKTTLFEAVAGLLPAERGSVTFEGKPLTLRSAALFYLPDGIRPWRDERVGWVLDRFAAMFGRERDEDAVSALELEGLLHQRVASLSKGEAKRFTLALALATPQPLLLLDEPFEGLDFKQTRGVMELLRARVDRGRTLILSIHGLIDAARICDRFLLLDHGRAIAAGSLSDLQARIGVDGATLEEVFLALE